jgi:hypothetical protein
VPLPLDVAHQSVLHDAQHPSTLVMPVIPVRASGKASAAFPIKARQ